MVKTQLGNVVYFTRNTKPPFSLGQQPLDIHHELLPEDRGYGEAVIRTVNSKRKQHLEQKLANDGLLVELSYRARLNVAGLSRG